MTDMTAKGGKTPEARLAAAERQKQVVLLRIRGVAFDSIGKQLGITRQSAHALYKKALRLTPRADVEEMRKLEAERIADLRQRIWARLAGQADKDGRTIPPDNEDLVALINQAIRLARHEALVFGLDSPSKTEVHSSIVGARTSDAELDIKLARLTPDEQDQFMVLVRKLEGRYVEPPAIEDDSSVATTGTSLEDSPN
jgi:transcriptional regulator